MPALEVEVKRWRKKVLLIGSSEWFLEPFSIPACGCWPSPIQAIPHPSRRPAPAVQTISDRSPELDQVLIEPHRDVIVVLNLACVPQTNLIDKPPQMCDATKESFGAAGISLLRHSVFFDL
jgi:hypothetical protein